MVATAYDFETTRNEIIQSALGKIGVLPRGETASAEDVAVASQALNEMVKEWQNERIFLWTLLPISLTLVIGQETYNLGDDPPYLAVDSAYYVSDSGDEETPIQINSVGEYREISTKGDSGIPEYLAYDADADTAYLYPTPNTTNHINVVGIRSLEDFDSASGVGDFKNRWSLALTYGLAAILADDYKLPLSERDSLALKAERYFSRAAKADRVRVSTRTVKGAY